MPGKTTRRTSGKKITAKVKPSKTKRKKGKGSKTLTAALNTYKSVKQKIFPGNKKSKTASSEEVEDIPVRKRMEYVGDKVGAGNRIVGATLDALSLDEKMDTPSNRLHGIVNHEDDPVDSELLSQKKILKEVVMYGSKKKKKKDNTFLYILLIAVAAFAIYKMTAKK